jgi:hypothetical protein
MIGCREFAEAMTQFGGGFSPVQFNTYTIKIPGVATMGKSKGRPSLTLPTTTTVVVPVSTGPTGGFGLDPSQRLMPPRQQQRYKREMQWVAPRVALWELPLTLLADRPLGPIALEPPEELDQVPVLEVPRAEVLPSLIRRQSLVQLALRTATLTTLGRRVSFDSNGILSFP